MVEGTIRSGAAPVSNAPVLLDGGRETRTDTGGTFRFRNVRVGIHTVEVRSIGKAPVTFAVDVKGDDTVRAEVDLEKITMLDSMLVEGSTVRQGFVKAYEERKRTGLGRYLDSTEIRKFARVQQALSFVPNVRSEKKDTIKFGTAIGSCLPNVWIDKENWGLEQAVLATLRPDDIMAIEVYTRQGLIPDEFRPRGREMGCGALVVWTRRFWPQGKGK